MTGSDLFFATPPTKPCATGATAQTPAPPVATRAAKKPIILDMGEASREQGFRMNGCR
jgi:hypothetical protein